jgi:hypothetical protein
MQPACERILNTENSYFFCHIANDHQFWFPENRMGAAFSQIPLLLLSHWVNTWYTMIAMLPFSKGEADKMKEKSFLPAIFILILPFVICLLLQAAKIK